MPKNIDNWIIDLDGTLVDSRIDITNSLNLTFKLFGLPTVSSELVEKYVGIGVTDIIKNIVPEELLTEYLLEFDKTYLLNITKNTKLYPGWNDILKNTSNIPKIILSNKYLKFCTALINNLNLSQHFIAVYGRDSFQECKPSPYPILEILRIHNFSKDKTIMIGDTQSDLQSGTLAGVKTCGVLYGYTNKEIIINCNPTYTINKAYELLEL